MHLLPVDLLAMLDANHRVSNRKTISTVAVVSDGRRIQEVNNVEF